MKRFFKRIHEKSVDTSHATILMTALGDSVTQGAMELGRWSPEKVDHRLFQQQLESLYPSTPFSMFNAGVDGNNAKQGLERMPRDVIRHQPDLVLVAFGLNDCGAGLAELPGFEETLLKIVGLIRSQTEADIVLITPPFMAREQTSRVHPQHQIHAESIFRLQNEGVLAAYAETIRKVAREQKVVLADVHAEWARLEASGVNTTTWLCNGLNHPDELGHQLAASVLFGTVFAQREQP